MVNLYDGSFPRGDNVYSTTSEIRLALKFFNLQVGIEVLCYNNGRRRDGTSKRLPAAQSGN